MENTGFLGSRVSISYISFFLKFLQINNNIPYLLAAPKKPIFSLKFLCASHLKIKHFELPPANGMGDMKTKLTEMHNRCPILDVGCCWLSVIFQISNFEAILYLGHLFDAPCTGAQQPEDLYMGGQLPEDLYIGNRQPQDMYIYRIESQKTFIYKIHCQKTYTKSLSTSLHLFMLLLG